MRRASFRFGLIVGALLLLPQLASAAVAGPWAYPLEPWDIDPKFQFGSPYGNNVHLGEDVEMPAGTPVRAAANGKVVHTGNYGGVQNYGGLVLMETQNADGSYVTQLYGHLRYSSLRVRAGQEVFRGDIIGVLGDYHSNGGWNEHLHYAIRNGRYSSQWVYWGFHLPGTLRQWHKPSAYISSHASVKEVGRVPRFSQDRFETAVGVSQWLYGADGSANGVILVNGSDHDAGLASVPLAASESAALLLTQSSYLPAATLAEIQRVLPTGGGITVVGDTTRINQAVVDQLSGLGYVMERISAPASPELSVEIASRLPASSNVFVVGQDRFPDAISASGPAADLLRPILITDPDDLSSAVSDYLASTGTTHVEIIGGPEAVGPAVMTELASLASLTFLDRIGGADRYNTNVMVLDRYVPAPSVFVIATGAKAPDAITGGLLAAAEDAALALSAPNYVPNVLTGYLRATASGAARALMLGGPEALNERVELDIAKLLNGFI